MYTYKAHVNRVIDGDTVDMTVDLGFYMFARMHFRLDGIDTPELIGAHRQEALAAKQFVVDKIEGKDVMIATSKADKFGRWLAVVYPFIEDGKTTALSSINEELIANGMAKPYSGGKREE